MKPDAPVTVWIVEDDPHYREALKRLVDTMSLVECRRVFSAFEPLLDALETDTPEVLLSDIELPGMDGLTGIEELKRRSPGTHVIVLTVFQDDDKVFRALCGGASGYLLKPSSADIMERAIHSVRAGGTPINPHIAKKVLDVFTRFAAPPEEYGLTAREKEILGLLVDEMSKSEIAESLFVSYHTVDMHLRNIYSKLQVHSKSGAVAKALRERLI